MSETKTPRRERTPGRKLSKQDLTSITGGKQVLLRGCCTQECCGGDGGAFQQIKRIGN